ncbi:hypothetical protein D9M68_635120 [compost metagenome]
MQEADLLNSQAERRVLLGILEFVKACLRIKRLGSLNGFDRVREIGYAPSVRPQRRNVGHHMYEPRAFVDQCSRQFSTRNVVLQADLVVHVGEQAGCIGDNPRANEIMDQFEPHVAGSHPIQAGPGLINVEISALVDDVLGSFSMEDGNMEAAVQESVQFGAVASLRPLHAYRQVLENPTKLGGNDGVERYINRDRHESQAGASIAAQELKPSDVARHLNKLAADKTKRQHDSCKCPLPAR